MENLSNNGLSHLFMTVFLHCFSIFMVIPSITDITMSAICPGKDECSIAIYLTGIQHAIIGLGSLIIMPVLGNLSDTHGRKVMLMLPLTLSIFPLVILAYSRTKYYFYAYYVLKTLVAIVCEGNVHCLALAYVADVVPESRRASVFGVLSGIASSAFVCGNLSTRFLSTASTFQVAATVAVIALVYTRMFLPEPLKKDQISTKGIETICLLERAPKNKFQLFKTLPSFNDVLCLLRNSSTFLHAAIVSFFANVAHVGLDSSLLYFLKAQFHFNKNQFADLLIISGIAGSISQLLLMPILVPALGEEKLLSVGLFFSCVHILLYSIAWSSWVPYASALISVMSIFVMPCLKSIASKQVGPNEQGKVQGCITGICSFASVVSPLIFSPLTALFLSDHAPFHFPGFGLTCAAFALMIAFIESFMISSACPVIDCSLSNSDFEQP
ncbi:tetracycline resistance protein, class E-like [Solanum tuberosum]|nr:PREDICTED: tetracycline resistance protein, class E-like [Solanum tuberosum]